MCYIRHQVLFFDGPQVQQDRHPVQHECNERHGDRLQVFFSRQAGASLCLLSVGQPLDRREQRADQGCICGKGLSARFPRQSNQALDPESKNKALHVFSRIDMYLVLIPVAVHVLKMTIFKYRILHIWAQKKRTRFFRNSVRTI